MDLNSVSSDDVLESYKRQLGDAHSRIAFLEAQVAKAQRLDSERRIAATEDFVVQNTTGEDVRS